MDDHSRSAMPEGAHASTTMMTESSSTADTKGKGKAVEVIRGEVEEEDDDDDEDDEEDSDDDDDDLEDDVSSSRHCSVVRSCLLWAPGQECRKEEVILVSLGLMTVER